MMRILLHADASAFLARAEAWLMRAELQHTMALRSARFACTDDSHFQKPLYWATVEQGDEIVGCAFRTPPYRLGITDLPLDAIPALVDSVAAVYGSLSGVAGPEPAASAFTAAWSELRGGSWSVHSRQRLLAHKVVVPANNPPPGALRLATAADGALAHQWGAAFARESGLAALDGAFCVRLIAAGQLYFWDRHAPCCMLGVLRETHDAAAIGVLYTPPALRERGYAAATVAAFSSHLLDRGLAHSYFCLDPGNVVADSICLRLGYGLVQETADIDFVAA
jgi:hypothetical protein